MTPWVMRLLIANIVVYFLQNVMGGITQSFAFVPYLALQQPWTIITYMFLHGSIMHILFNMIALYFFGPQVEARLGGRHFISLYFASGISGGLLSMVLAPASPIIGASAAIFGVMLAFAYFWPNAPIYIWGVLPIPARILVIITTVLSLWSGFGGSRGGIADFAHLGGYVGAAIYLWAMQRSAKKFKQRALGGNVGVGLSKKSNGPTLANWRAVDTNRVHEVNREEVNRILDKISAKGLGSLTEQEKLFLSNFVPPDDKKPPVS